MKADQNSSIKALILDMDGVVWRGDQPLGNLPELFARIDRLGYRVGFATNNATATPAQVQARLKGFGVQAGQDQIVNSSLAIVHYLQEKFPQGGPVYIVGEEGLTRPLHEAGFFDAEKDCVAVVASMDRSFTYQKLTYASRIIREGAVFIGSNPDKTFPSPGGLTPGAGSILAAIEAASGVTPLMMGKPFPDLFLLSLERLGVTPQQALVVGDRLETDILGGHNAGCQTALVLSGVSTLEDAQKFQPRPDRIAADLTELVDTLE